MLELGSTVVETLVETFVLACILTIGQRMLLNSVATFTGNYNPLLSDSVHIKSLLQINGARRWCVADTI